MKNKIITVQQAVEFIKEGDRVMIGGFLSCGTPEVLMDAIVDQQIGNLTVIANDSGANETRGIGKLVSAKLVEKLIVSHIGTNKETGNQMAAGELLVDLVPQGTLAERIRAGGVGLGGILTPTGIGTQVEENKSKIVVEGVEYLLETPLTADVALIQGTIVDTKGNVYYSGTTKNFNPIMAMAAKTVIVVADKIVEPGQIDPNYVMTPGILVDYIVGGDLG